MHARRVGPAVAALATLVLVTSAAPAGCTELLVSAAASLSDALREIGATYEKTRGIHIVYNFGASSLLARQIQEGAPADIFFSADEAKMNDLAARQMILPATRRSLLSNSLVVVVPSDAPRHLARIAELASPRFRTIAIADPTTVPAGIYAKRYLLATGVWTKVAGRLIPTDNVRAALLAVASGNADAGIVYKTDAMHSTQVAIALEVPAREGPRISYPVAVVATSARPEQARLFVGYLASAAGLGVFRKYGFLNAPGRSGQRAR